MLTILGTIGIVLATIAVGLLVDRKWDIIPRKEKLLAAGKRGLPAPAHAAGEAPATAVTASAGEIEKLRRRRCDACRGATVCLADDRVTYGERELLVLHTRCECCGKQRSTYVDRVT